MGYTSNFLIPVFIQQVILLSTFYENYTIQGSLRAIKICTISCQNMA